jgi:hypothetical protein
MEILLNRSLQSYRYYNLLLAACLFHTISLIPYYTIMETKLDGNNGIINIWMGIQEINTERQ